MSSVGLAILIGDLLKQGKRDKVKGSVLAYAVRNAVKNATYVGKTIVPLLVIGQPTGSMSAGPASPFFQKLDTLGMSARDYLVAHYSYATIALVTLLASAVAFLVSYSILVNYSRKLTVFAFKNISAEALYGLLIAIVPLSSILRCWNTRAIRNNNR
jgi:hypothetical protein